jgi:excisionase family DNA binding protein
MPSYLTTSDVAIRLGVSLDTVRRWLRSGELKGAPFGRAGYRIEDADFQAFFQQRRRQSQGLVSSLPERAALGDFMIAVGQELRTPMTTTRGALQQARRLVQRLLESPAPDNAHELLSKLQDLLARAERQTSAEMRLAENLLDAARIEANMLELSLGWCNLAELVRETVAKQQELTTHRTFEQELPHDDLVAVIADADRIKQALTHYLINAVKFSPIDQPINILLEVRDAQAYIAVQNKGPGIPVSEQERIWERFGQGQNQATGTGNGLGLGLYITRAIIQQHHGQVGVESQVEEGATFWFILPLAEEI